MKVRLSPPAARSASHRFQAHGLKAAPAGRLTWSPWDTASGASMDSTLRSLSRHPPQNAEEAGACRAALRALEEADL